MEKVKWITLMEIYTPGLSRQMLDSIERDPGKMLWDSLQRPTGFHRKNFERSSVTTEANSHWLKDATRLMDAIALTRRKRTGVARQRSHD